MKAKAKTKNPLYVVKGKDVQEASSVLDLVIKKLSLEPAIKVFQSLLQILMEHIKTYPAFIAMKEFFDNLVAKYFELAKKFGIA